jgi:hypothetical protein
MGLKLAVLRRMTKPKRLSDLDKGRLKKAFDVSLGPQKSASGPF